ncbi:hypothetical protein YC2023_093333 [Brassica napus]
MKWRLRISLSLKCFDLVTGWKGRVLQVTGLKVAGEGQGCRTLCQFLITDVK